MLPLMRFFIVLFCFNCGDFVTRAAKLARPDKGKLQSATGLKLHVLKAGDGFNLKR